MIFNIQRYSTHDGPGIRTVIFLKGCSLSCFWCQNPESRSPDAQLLFDKRLCIKDCQICCEQFPAIFSRHQHEIHVQRSKIASKDYSSLKHLCPSTAIAVCGQALAVDEIMQTVNKDAVFYQRTEGGVTLSGGEPFMQPALAKQLFSQCKRHNYHTAVETCLHVPWKNIVPSLPYIDLFLADLKHTDETIFKAWTNGSAKRILKNFHTLSLMNKTIIIRVPLIQGFNADEKSVKQIIDFTANETSAKEIHFLPYHTLGMNKYAMLDMPYHAPKTPLHDSALIDYALAYASERKLSAILRG